MTKKDTTDRIQSSNKKTRINLSMANMDTNIYNFCSHSNIGLLPHQSANAIP
jgi:hypothetical protein